MNNFIPQTTVVAALLLISACAPLGLGQPEDTSRPEAQGAEASDVDVAATKPDPVLTAAPRPPKAAQTQETLDTTTPDQRAKAAAPVATAQALGTTVASLGSPSEPGFWLKTPLVKSETSGRVTNKANGKSSAVTLIPIDGTATAGSRLSLPAMRLIEAPLTELIELDVSLSQ